MKNKYSFDDFLEKTEIKLFAPVFKGSLKTNNKFYVVKMTPLTEGFNIKWYQDIFYYLDLRRRLSFQRSNALTEEKVLKKLNHPNIAELFDSFYFEYSGKYSNIFNFLTVLN